MAKKKTAAVKKAAKTPTAKVLKAEIATLGREETSLKHGAATSRSASTRKHDAAEAASIAKRVTKLRHELSKKHSAKTKTGLALAPGDVSCCAAQALAASLRLALGVAVHEQDVLALYWRTAGDPDEGASILATLEAAREHGLAGLRPHSSTSLTCGNVIRDLRNSRSGGGPEFPAVEHALILHLDLPEGPHAVTAAPDGAWWSWGEPYSPDDFPGAVIEEAWAVAWQ